MTRRPALLAATALAAFSPLALRAADAPLVLGAVFPLTGAYGSYGAGISAAIALGVEEVNAAGGVLGQPIEVKVEDDQTDPTAGLNAARKLIDVDGVDAIIATFASSVTLPILAYSAPAGVPVLTVSGAPEITEVGKTTGLAYRFVATEGYFAVGYARLAAAKGFKRAYVLAANNAAMLDAAKSFEATFPGLGGEVLGTTVFEPGQASYQAELAEALDTGPDVVMLAAYTPEAITMAKMLYQLDPEVRIVGPLYSLNDSFIEGVGAEVAEGTLAVDAMSAEGTPAYAAFAPRYQEATGTPPTANPYAVMDYDMVIVAALAAAAAGSTEPAAFAPKIREVASAPGEKVTSFAEGARLLAEGRDIDYDGASSAVDFTAAGDLESMFLRTFTIEGGKVVAGDVLN